MAHPDRTFLAPGTPLANAVTRAIREGDLAELETLLAEAPDLATAQVGAPDGTARTLLHLATDWPGHYPNGPAVIATLVRAGADVNARFVGSHRETALHWAASNDDVPALDALLDAGADIEADGAVIGGGTPLADACAFGQWSTARRLVERGAVTNLWQEASLGLVDRLSARLPVPDADLAEALWAAAHGGQLETVQLLHAQGADPHWIGYDDLTALGAAERAVAPDVVAWLRAHGCTDPGPGAASKGEAQPHSGTGDA